MKQIKKCLNIVVIVMVLSGLFSTINAKDIKSIFVNNFFQVNVGDQKILLDGNKKNTKYNLQTLEKNTNLEIKFLISEEISKDIDIYVNGKYVKNNYITIYINKISEQDKINIKLVDKNTKDIRNYYINTLPDDFVEYSVFGESKYEGDYHITIGNRIFKMDGKGDVIYYLTSYNSTGDFKKHIVDDKVRYSYYDTDHTINMEGVFAMFGTIRILDEQYNLIDQIRLEENEGIEKGMAIDGHDFIYIDDNHYIVLGYVSRVVNNIPSEKEKEVKVIAAVIQEIKDGKVVWQWDSTEHKELYSSSKEFNDFTGKYLGYADYLHINSITLDLRDGNIICSFRNSDTIMKIERGTDQIMWKLGGEQDEFGLKNNQKTSRQHMAYVTEEGTITVFDNGNINRESRIVEYKIDEEKKKLLEFKEYKVPGHFSSACGSVQKLDENVFNIGWGVRGEGEPGITEVDFNTDTINFEVTFKNTDNLYRVLKFK